MFGLVTRYSTVAALILVASVATASAAQPRVHQSIGIGAPQSGLLSAPVTRIDQDGNYVMDRTPGAIPTDGAWNPVWTR